MSPQCIATQCNLNLYLDQPLATNHEMVMPASITSYVSCPMDSPAATRVRLCSSLWEEWTHCCYLMGFALMWLLKSWQHTDSARVVFTGNNDLWCMNKRGFEWPQWFWKRREINKKLYTTLWDDEIYVHIFKVLTDIFVAIRASVLESFSCRLKTTSNIQSTEHGTASSVTQCAQCYRLLFMKPSYYSWGLRAHLCMMTGLHQH